MREQKEGFFDIGAVDDKDHAIRLGQGFFIAFERCECELFVTGFGM